MSAELNQTNALSDAYRADGLVKTQVVSAFTTAGWYRTYTDADRLSSVAGADTQNLTYDASGQLATYAVTGGTASYTHDPEGSVLTNRFRVSLVWAGSATLVNTVNVRGELIDRGNSAKAGGHTRTRTNAGCHDQQIIDAMKGKVEANVQRACERVKSLLESGFSPKY